jgi:ABC-type transport system substrate-binding protein
MKELAYTTNPATFQKKVNEADELYIEATPEIQIYNFNLVTVLSKDITGFYSDDQPEMRFWEKD